MLLAPTKTHGANPLVNFHAEKSLVPLCSRYLIMLVCALEMHGSFMFQAFVFNLCYGLKVQVFLMQHLQQMYQAQKLQQPRTGIKIRNPGWV